MHLLKAPRGDKVERAMEMAKPLTPLADRRYEGRIAPLSVPDMGCVGRCVLRVGHTGPHWPRIEG